MGVNLAATKQSGKGGRVALEDYRSSRVPGRAV